MQGRVRFREHPRRNRPGRPLLQQQDQLLIRVHHRAGAGLGAVREPQQHRAGTGNDDVLHIGTVHQRLDAAEPVDRVKDASANSACSSSDHTRPACDSRVRAASSNASPMIDRARSSRTATSAAADAGLPSASRLLTCCHNTATRSQSTAVGTSTCPAEGSWFNWSALFTTCSAGDDMENPPRTRPRAGVANPDRSKSGVVDSSGNQSGAPAALVIGTPPSLSRPLRDECPDPLRQRTERHGQRGAVMAPSRSFPV